MHSSSHSRVRGLLLPGTAMLAVAALAAGCSSGSTTSKPTSSASSTLALQSDYELVVRDVLPSVVQISTDGSTGSGIVYDTKGDIVTNNHVVGKATTVDVRPATGTTVLTGKVIGTFPPDDLAVVRVTSDASELKPAKFANSSEVQIGEIVLAMGNPLGFTDSVTQGIVSATGRTVGEGGSAVLTDAIQTSAAINPGNSGGALVNLDDQVIGVPTLAARLPDESGGLAAGIGFAIPSNTVKSIASQLIETGRVTNSGRASLDITADTVANGQGMPVGVGVAAVTSGGSAETAGIRPGDIIIGFDGADTPTLGALEGMLAELKPGAKADVRFVRNGSTKTVTAKLGTLTG